MPIPIQWQSSTNQVYGRSNSTWYWDSNYWMGAIECMLDFYNFSLNIHLLIRSNANEWHRTTVRCRISYKSCILQRFQMKGVSKELREKLMKASYARWGWINVLIIKKNLWSHKSLILSVFSLSNLSLNHEGVCNGDSGSPLIKMHGGELIGISSWTIKYLNFKFNTIF